jgi:hypothetical protein
LLKAAGRISMALMPAFRGLSTLADERRRHDWLPPTSFARLM